MTPGTRVRFTNPDSVDERNATMVVIEDRDNRVLVYDLRHEGWSVRPTAVYAKTDLVPIRSSVGTSYNRLRSGEDLARERFLDRE